ncbi:hypothetical protein, partial [Phenylobacterium sp.]|uniref:hypothetical protein n=1 Tax=Phenylobacterium sp. TaxID=1871053 RepID=UPI0035664F80
AAPPRARAAHLARRHRALTKPPAPKLASHRLISLPRHAAARDTAAAARPASAIADIADLYAQSIRDLDRRQGLAALADPPY